MTTTAQPTTAPAVDQHLRGPWVAVLADSDGFVHPTWAEAMKHLGEDEEMTISIVRGTALPTDDGDSEQLRMAGSYDAGDLIELGDAYLVDDDDPSLGAEARYAQAQAMADGLNHVGKVDRLREQIYAQQPVIVAVQAWAEVRETEDATTSDKRKAAEQLHDAIEQHRVMEMALNAARREQTAGGAR